MRKPARKQGRSARWNASNLDHTGEVQKETMLDDYGFEIYENNNFPIAYLLTFRTYGTWHHGDARSSVGRDGTNNVFGAPMIKPRNEFVSAMKHQQAQPSFTLEAECRRLVATAVREVCGVRSYVLRAVNIRSNHGHAVVSASCKPEKIVNELKAYSTRRLREANVVDRERKIWSRGASTRYLWKPKHVIAAVDYVLYCQEDIPFDFQDSTD